MKPILTKQYFPFICSYLFSIPSSSFKAFAYYYGSYYLLPPNLNTKCPINLVNHPSAMTRAKHENGKLSMKKVMKKIKPCSDNEYDVLPILKMF
ncbi:hypothetical protein M0811_00638 [Anaeramoeba ignava]|uniref:Uncharacterized protein n=1 Tax=Anaeramoeba ignava TaxID=1746090 RepID=A0A9Q0LLK0_ANAIG|nr:hypothetical protein M0811_00638 [Anaeramoeba ignava]